ncbi:response regulator [Caldicellulosiruptor acetigenus]|uniref:response regulator n=1 Tax=Caldicellulosiruptor acetigenus TaxID=301953 RepID=UPI0003F53104|nr:response regulator [Caldicellulosiruptor acetigenus]WAM36336.1 response regulator [Caldicellulosiruptor acetigenus]
MYKMMIVDDEYYVKEGLKQTIDWNKYQIEIVGDAENGEDALNLAKTLNPDIIITDIRMPILDGVEFMKRLRENEINSHLIVISAYDDFEYARAAIKYGATNYILKPIDNNELIETIQKVIKKIESERNFIDSYNSFKNNISVLKLGLLREIVYGKVSDSHLIKETLSYFKVDSNNITVITIRIANYDKTALTANEHLRMLKEYITNQILNNVFARISNGGINLEKDEDELVIIIGLDGDTTTLYEQLKNEFCYLVKKINKKFQDDNFTVAVGISDIHPWDSISKAYREATLASNYSPLPELNIIGCARDKDLIGIRKEVKDALKMIVENYNRDITIDEVANKLHISTSHLMHLFKDELGKTFYDCLVEYRISKAKELLLSTNLKVYEVAEKVGYQDAKYFSQLFKKYTGFTPKEYVDYHSFAGDLKDEN